MTAPLALSFDEAYYCQRDPFWREVSTLRHSDGVFLRIFEAFRAVGALTCAGDVLLGLARGLVPYPLLRAPRPPSGPRTLAPCRQGKGARVHPGPATHFHVAPLPIDLQLARARLDASDDFCALVDQCLLGAAWYDGTAFPPLAEVDEVPWRALGEVGRLPHGLAVLRDWGTIVRMALSTNAGPLSQRYERAMLRWLVQRFAFDDYYYDSSDAGGVLLASSSTSSEEEAAGCVISDCKPS